MVLRWRGQVSERAKSFAGLALVAWIIAVVFWLPHSKEVCASGQNEAEKYCATYDIAPGLMLEVMRFLDAHEGTFMFLVSLTLFAVAVLQWRTMADHHLSAKRIERAYIFLSTTPTIAENMQLPLLSGMPRPLQFCNFGKTPAQIDRLIASCRYLSGGEAEAVALQRQPRDARPDETTAIWLAGNGAPMGTKRVPTTASPQDIQAATQGNGVVVLMGTLEYRDVFDEPHEVGFAYYMSGSAPIADGGGGVSFSVDMREVPNRHLNYSR